MWHAESVYYHHTYTTGTYKLIVTTLDLLTEIEILVAHQINENKKNDHWSCIAHLSAEDMLKLVVIEENKF